MVCSKPPTHKWSNFSHTSVILTQHSATTNIPVTVGQGSHQYFKGACRSLIWHLPGMQAAISATFPRIDLTLPCTDLSSTWPVSTWPFLAMIWHLPGLQAAIQATFPCTDLTSTWPAGIGTCHLSLHGSDIYLARRQRHKLPFLALIWHLHLPGLLAVIQATFSCTDLTSTWPAGSDTSHLFLYWFDIYLAGRQ